MNNKRNIRQVFVVLSVVLLVIQWYNVPARANANAGTFEGIDTYIAMQLEKLQIPGASLAIVEGDQIVHTQGFGVTRPGGEAPSPQTPYFIGSLTKSITALATMQLVEAGQVELDAPIQRYLPWFTLADPQAAAQITVRHLLNQTSGFSQIPGMIALSDFDNTPGAAERQARALSDLELIHPVGTTFEYSNLNFNLLGLVIEAASGESYAEYVQNHIYAPLDMQHSYTSKAAAQQDQLAVGHQMWFGFPVAVPDLPVAEGSLPSGQLIASAEDIGHYLIAQLNQGQYAGRQIISPEGMAQMHQPAVDVNLGDMNMGDYGMGWFVVEAGGEPLIFHDGEVPDYFAYMGILPAHQRALVLLVNANQQMYNYALWDMSEKATLMLADIQPAPNSWGVLPWIVRGFLLLPLLQILFIIAALRRVKHWQMNPTSRPGRTRLWLLHLALPTLLNLVLVAPAAALLVSGMLKFIMLFMGDIVSVLVLSGGIALVWVFVRVPLFLRSTRQPGKTGDLRLAPGIG